MKKELCYKTGYKYQVTSSSCWVDSGIKGISFDSPFFQLCSDGMLGVFRGYAWDGTTGPSIDTQTNIFQSLWHDILCQIASELDDPELRAEADLLFKEMLTWRVCIDGKCKKMNPFRRAYHYLGVRLGARFHIGTKKEIKVTVYKNII